MLLGGTLLAVGCSSPAVEGYQLQGTPEGFLYAQLQEWNASVLRDRPAKAQGMWMGDIGTYEPRTTIQVTTYEGGAERRAAEEARDAREEQLAGASSILVGPVRDLPLSEGGVAWAWAEERFDEYARLASLKVSAVASFDSVTFALEFDTDVPERMNLAHADGVLTTFALGRTVVHWNALVAAAVIVGLVALVLGRSTRPRRPAGYRLWEKGEPGESSSPPPDAMRPP